MVCRLPALRILLPSAMFLATTALPATMANAAAGEASRGQTTVTVERNAITVDNDLKYVAYAQDETIRVTLDYSATCNVVFAGLTMFRPVPFSPRTVTGSMGNVRGTPLPEHPGNRGSVSFDLRFTTLNETSPGAKSGLARLNLVLGVDKDCDLATGDSDGIDRPITIRAQVRVTTEAE